MLRIGPSGNSNRFYEEGYKHTYEAPKWLHEIGLNAFEYSFGRGVSMSEAMAKRIGSEMQKYDIQLSVHAPYYINLVKTEIEDILKSFNFLISAAKIGKVMGARRVVAHPGYVGSYSRADACLIAQKNLESLLPYLEKEGLEDSIICIESMGKHSQIGTAEEVVEMVRPFSNMNVCFDFGHINSYLLGGLKTKDDFRRVIDCAFKGLGDERAKTMHIHFSKILFGAKGEIKHLTFEDTKYGPEYKFLAEIIDEYDMSPTVICESDGVMAEDALVMRSYHQQR